MSDLISRQAAIDAIFESALKYTGFMEMEMYTDDDAVEAINGVPSAEPERKMGKWILFSPKSYLYSCSLCGQWADRRWNFCPNCGARMDVPDNDVGKTEGEEG